MRYKIYSFRGFDYASDFEEAWEVVKRMLEEISNDGFGIEFRWVVIMDNKTNKKKVVSSVEAGQYSTTHWIMI